MFVVLLAFPASAGAAEAGRFEAGAAYLYGPVSGSLQTPSGGEVGTTSEGRPTLGELGIDDVPMVDFGIDVRLAGNGFYAGGRLIHLRGDGTLPTDLLSQARTFPAGRVVEAAAAFDWYRLGYSRHFLLPWGSRRIDLAPSVGAALLTYDFDLTSPGLEAVDRCLGSEKSGLHSLIDLHMSFFSSTVRRL
jgi:hypothetical protein